MPLSSGRASLLVCGSLLAAASCASAPPGAVSDDPFTVEGILEVEGDHPFDRVIIVEDSAGVKWPLEGGDLDYELSLMQGHRVSVSCRRAGFLAGEERLRVEGYTLSPIDGMVPVRGVVTMDSGTPAFVSGDKTFTLTGPLSDALGGWEDHKAWVWGTESGGAEGSGPSMEISGFEILGRKGELSRRSSGTGSWP